MQAPPLATPQLQLESVRCSCQTENLLVWPVAWYEGQGSIELEPTCASCDRSLLGNVVPEGAVLMAYTADNLPDSVARALGSAATEEYCRNRKPVLDGVPERWDRPHDAPAAYQAWVAEQPVEDDLDRAWLIQNMAITGVLVVVVALLALL
jgi:hypothetical protein